MGSVTPKAQRKLNFQQVAFAHEYIIDRNGTQAAIRAGYSKKTAYASGNRLLKDVRVIDLINELTIDMTGKCKVDAEYVLRESVAMYEADVADILNDDGSVKPIKEWPKIWRTSISAIDVQEIYASNGDEKELAAIVKKLKMPDKLSVLKSIGDHVQVLAYKTVTKVEGDLSVTSNMSDAELERIAGGGD